MTITASSGQQSATPVQFGNKLLALVNGSQPGNILATAPAAGSIIPIASQRITLSIAPVGTIADDLVVTLSGEINGSSYFPLYYPGTKNLIQWTGADIKQVIAGSGPGILATIDGLKVNTIKFVMAIGATAVSASNGVNTRVMD